MCQMTQRDLFRCHNRLECILAATDEKPAGFFGFLLPRRDAKGAPEGVENFSRHEANPEGAELALLMCRAFPGAH